MASAEDKDRKDSTAVIWAKYSQIAFVLPCAVIVGLLIGKLLDHWFHTHWIFVAGIIVGAIAGFVDIIRTAFRG